MKNNYLLVECRSFTPLIAAADDVLKSTNLDFITYKRTGSAYYTAFFAGQHSACINGEEIAVKSVENICSKIPSANIIKAGVSRLISSKIITAPEQELVNLFLSPGNRVGRSKNDDFDTKRIDSLIFIDARGLTALISAADEIIENYPVEIVDCRKMGSGRLTLIIAGKIDILESALERAISIVKTHGKYIGSSLLSNVDEDILKSL